MSTNSAVSDSGAKPSSNTGRGNVMVEVANKISGAKNVLVALSGNPSVDEMAAAIGLTLYLDRLGKRATAIYSGTTPNALEFLEPEKTFESTADALQDFVIALNKDKADHLRYKLDGEYVKIYITPYKTRIDSRDLEFSYGDYNVDLVIALDVMNGSDLDAALREHGRIMHDASVINITTGDPGKLGEIEWNDKSASSVSEMIAKLLYSASGEATIEKDDATAFLTGIVAATNRFSNAKTTPDTMQIASRLMESGANQQLVSKNITPDAANKSYEADDKPKEVVKHDTPTTIIQNPFVVEFEKGKSALTNRAIETLNLIPSNSVVTIEASASPEGTSEFNQKLSDERAERVASYLINRGVKIKSSRGIGSTGPDSQRIVKVFVR